MTPETLTHDLVAKVDDAFELVDRGLASHTVLLVHLDSAARKVRYFDAEVAAELSRVSAELATLPQPTRVQVAEVRQRLQRWIAARAERRLRGATSEDNREEAASVAPVASPVELPSEDEPIVSIEELEALDGSSAEATEEEAQDEAPVRPRRTL